MSNNIEGKVIFITGASSGLGEATARLLSEEGAPVVLGARHADRVSTGALRGSVNHEACNLLKRDLRRNGAGARLRHRLGDNVVNRNRHDAGVVSPGAVATELPNSVTEPDVAENIRKFYERPGPTSLCASRSARYEP